MNDYWNIVLLFVNAKEIITISKLNRAHKKFVSLFYFKQRLTITSFFDFTELLSNVSRVQCLSLPFLENIIEYHNFKNIFPPICKQNGLLFLDLWCKVVITYYFLENVLCLPPTLIGLRIDANLFVLDLLSRIAPQLEHIAIFCIQRHNEVYYNIVEILLRFKSLKCVHFYNNLFPNYEWTKFNPKEHNLPFIVTFDLFRYGLTNEFIVCQHEQNFFKKKEKKSKHVNKRKL